MEKKLLMIVNPVAGTKRLRPLLLDVISIFSAGGFATTVMVTGRRGDAAEFAARGGDFDRIVCCGGDGTLNETISGMLDAGVTIPLGYIPCGIAYVLRGFFRYFRFDKIKGYIGIYC